MILQRFKFIRSNSLPTNSSPPQRKVSKDENIEKIEEEPEQEPQQSQSEKFQKDQSLPPSASKCPVELQLPPRCPADLPIPPNVKSQARNSPKPQRRPRIPTGSGIVKSGPAKIDLCPNLTSQQVIILRNTWVKIKNRNAQKDITGCFQAHERISPSVSMAFNSVTSKQEPNSKLWQPQIIINHTQSFVNILDRTIDNDPEIDDDLRRIGFAHVHLHEKFKLSKSEFDKFGEFVVERFLKVDGVKQSNEATQAWCILITSIIDHIKLGYESGIRSRRKSAVGLNVA